VVADQRYAGKTGLHRSVRRFGDLDEACFRRPSFGTPNALF